jgi:hypothetical protein
MAEVIVDHVRRLEFDVVVPGDKLVVTTGKDDEAWQYDFEVNDKKVNWPMGMLSAINPDGQSAEPVPFAMHGCGRWTTPKENPVQEYWGRAFTPYYDGLIVGSFMWGRFEGQPDRHSFTAPGQEISDIARTPYRSNTLLQILDAGEPKAVKQIKESLVDYHLPIAEKDIRTTLKELLVAKRISILHRRVQLYQINPSST